MLRSLWACPPGEGVTQWPARVCGETGAYHSNMAPPVAETVVDASRRGSCPPIGSAAIAAERHSTKAARRYVIGWMQRRPPSSIVSP
jgi:hypothetical protein